MPHTAHPLALKAENEPAAQAEQMLLLVVLAYVPAVHVVQPEEPVLE